MVFARKLNCNEPIERLFYSAKFADIYIHCSSQSVSPWNDTEEFYPVLKSFREKQDCQYKKLLGKWPLQSIARNSRTRTIIFRICIDYTSVYVNVECMDGIERWSSPCRAEVPQRGMLGAYVWRSSTTWHAWCLCLNGKHAWCLRLNTTCTVSMLGAYVWTVSMLGAYVWTVSIPPYMYM